jgi:protein-arginine kinase activator protein McsA
MPASRRREIDRQRSLADLRQQLTAAIGNENFEFAAILRDKIKKLESTK